MKFGLLIFAKFKCRRTVKTILIVHHLLMMEPVGGSKGFKGIRRKYWAILP